VPTPEPLPFPQPSGVSEHFWPGLAIRLAAWVDRWSSPAHWARARKYLVALMGVAAQLVAAGLIPDPWAGRVQLVLALATAVGVYAAPNAPPPLQAVDEQAPAVGEGP
jgi:hypothetical protein